MSGTTLEDHEARTPLSLDFGFQSSEYEITLRTTAVPSQLAVEDRRSIGGEGWGYAGPLNEAPVGPF